VRAAVHTARYWGPILAGFLCFVGSSMVGALVAWLLIVAGFGLILDGATAMFARATGTGGLTSHRQ